jgi:hypothetical protein
MTVNLDRIDKTVISVISLSEVRGSGVELRSPTTVRPGRYRVPSGKCATHCARFAFGASRKLFSGHDIAPDAPNAPFLGQNARGLLASWRRFCVRLDGLWMATLRVWRARPSPALSGTLFPLGRGGFERLAHPILSSWDRTDRRAPRVENDLDPMGRA